MDEAGTPIEEVIASIEEAKKKDLTYDHILSSMCTDPHPIAVHAHVRFIESNLGDSGLFPGTKEIEGRVIEMLASLLNYPSGTEPAAYLTTGGTESNIQAVRVARNLKNTDKPNIVIPASAHFSFDKIGDILRVELRKADVDNDLKVDIASVESLIDENTVGLVGIAGTTEFGQIDPIKELSDVALREGIYLHVDAAFGGFVIPFIEEKYDWNFKVEGVSSITIDPHKMGMSTIPSGGLFFRRQEDMDELSIDTPYLSTKQQYSLTGTRSGGAAAGTYAVLKHLGMRGMREVVQECIRLTRILVEEAASFGIYPVINPVMNVVALEVPDIDAVVVGLMRRGWRVSISRVPRALRLVIMPHISEETLRLFIDDFRDTIKG